MSESKEREVMYNECHGGFGFSDEFIKYLLEQKIDDDNDDDVYREDPSIIKCLKEFGLDKASKPPVSKVRIATVPKFYDYEIEEYDGLESVKITFPWERVARALYNKNDNEILNVLKSGELVIPIKE